MLRAWIADFRESLTFFLSDKSANERQALRMQAIASAVTGFNTLPCTSLFLKSKISFTKFSNRNALRFITINFCLCSSLSMLLISPSMGEIISVSGVRNS
ncbi:hypothetical protein SDC9_164925 [bioreactor metagenome]|uniref:Uncharacterized protein n=1 Tax=bioreactor metagenome TaxID=1076179 RepID=A0A645FV58_9ZZZZ